MEIYKGIEIIDLALRYKDILILGDLQLGYEEHLNKNGIMAPRFQRDDVIERLACILSERSGIKKIIFNGDIKHQFGSISSQEWDSISKLLENLIDKYEIIIVKGNHDVLIGPILKRYKEKIKLVDFYKIDDLMILHGDKILPCQNKVMIIGHEHPAISFREKPGEKYKCFLKGKWKGNALIVMPSFSMLTIGTDLMQERFLSPYLKENINDFEIYVVEDKVYNFGKLKNIK